MGKFAQLIWSIGLQKVQSVMLQHVWILFPCAWTVDIKTVQQPCGKIPYAKSYCHLVPEVALEHTNCGRLAMFTVSANVFIMLWIVDLGIFIHLEMF